VRVRRISRCRGATVSSLSLLALVLAILVCAPAADFVATDPGPRGGPPAAGGPVPGLNQAELALFVAGQDTIQEIDSVQGTVPDTGLGLGPRFNMDSCGGCHNYPAPGGTSPPVNPQVAVATKQGATNTVPFFVSLDGPIRHAFVKENPGGGHGHTQVHLYTVTGRADAPGCVFEQPDFDALAAANNLALHIPLQLYGLGLIEAIDAVTIADNLASNSAVKQALGIGGHAGASGHGRFGWKAQDPELLLVAAAAYPGEVGVTNALIRKESDQTPGCQFNPVPEDTGDPSSPDPVDHLPDFVKIAGFARFSAPPAPIPDIVSIASGRSLFGQVGCALCHTPSLRTGRTADPALSGKIANLYSDVALHQMGPGLADGLASGDAGPDEFRTTPLWGLGQRLFLLHDGRTSNLLEAIAAHASRADASFPASEANAVTAAFSALSEPHKQDVLNFLRAL
jgi:CxxC motif-containing protein (DUF1111 family)